MKKYLALALMVIMVVALAVGCSSEPKEVATTEVVTTEAVVEDTTEVLVDTSEQASTEEGDTTEEVQVVQNLDNRFVVTKLKMENEQLVMDFQSIVESEDVISQLTTALTAGVADAEAVLERFPDASIERTEGEVITSYMVWFEEGASFVSYDNSVYKLDSAQTKTLLDLVESTR